MRKSAKSAKKKQRDKVRQMGEEEKTKEKSQCTPLIQLTFDNVWKKTQKLENLSRI